jgi:hypothetical protein
MQVIIFKNENGGVALCTPTGELPIEVVLEKDVPKNRDAKIVNSEDLPRENFDFIDAWELINGDININLNKAREITKDRLRYERQSLLLAQDVAFQRALENGTDTTAIVAEKNRLRDITLLTDEATTLEELRNLHC